MNKNSSGKWWIAAAVSAVALISLAAAAIIRYRKEIAAFLHPEKELPLEEIEITDSDI